MVTKGSKCYIRTDLQAYKLIYRGSVDCIRMSLHLFKMDWLLMSICILCVFAIFLYALIDFGEKLYFKHF